MHCCLFLIHVRIKHEENNATYMYLWMSWWILETTVLLKENQFLFYWQHRMAISFCCFSPYNAESVRTKRLYAKCLKILKTKKYFFFKMPMHICLFVIIQICIKQCPNPWVYCIVFHTWLPIYMNLNL